MTIDEISMQCFIAVAESGNFTKASQIVGRTQSAVSQQISKLENFTSRQLFIRSRNMTLTNDGEAFLVYAKQILALHREVIDYFKNPELKGEIRFGAPEDFVSVFLYDILKEFSQTHPRISLNIECDLTYNLYEKFKARKLDLVIVKMPPPSGLKYGVELFSEKLEWVGNTNLIKNNEAIPLVLSTEPCVYRKKILQALDKKKIKWRIAFSTNSYASKVAAVKAGLGISAFPHTIIPDDIKIIRLKKLPTLQENHFSLLKHGGSIAAVNSLADFVIKKIN